MVYAAIDGFLRKEVKGLKELRDLIGDRTWSCSTGVRKWYETAITLARFRVDSHSNLWRRIEPRIALQAVIHATIYIDILQSMTATSCIIGVRAKKFGVAGEWFQQKLPKFWYNSIKFCTTFRDSNYSERRAQLPLPLTLPPRTPMSCILHGTQGLF